MVTRRVSEDFSTGLVNASGYPNTLFVIPALAGILLKAYYELLLRGASTAGGSRFCHWGIGQGFDLNLLEPNFVAVILESDMSFGLRSKTLPSAKFTGCQTLLPVVATGICFGYQGIV